MRDITGKEPTNRQKHLKIAEPAKAEPPNGGGAGGSDKEESKNTCQDNNNTSDKKEQAAKEPRQTQAVVMLQIVFDRQLDFFHDNNKEPYAVIPVDNHREVYALNSREFKTWLNQTFHGETGKPISGEAIQQTIAVLTGTALFDRPEPIDLQTRIAKKDKSFYYDLCNPEWQAVEVTPGGWWVSSNPPELFTRYRHQQAQPTPPEHGEVTDLLQYINIKKGRTLFLVWLVSCFVPGIPHPLLVLYGEKGSAKTTASELLKALIDPSSLDTLTIQKSTRAMAVNLLQHYYLPFDNVSFINEETSDTLCRAITGGGIQQRQLYTDSDDVIFTFKRAVSINGINNVATRPDLLDRSILIELERLPDGERQEAAAIREAFEQDKPGILAGIFDALSGAMKNYPFYHPKSLPRMADFARWGYVIGEAIQGGLGDVFLREYAENRATQNQEAIAADPVATLIVAFMQGREEWEGSATLLYKALKNVAGDNEIYIGNRYFPRDPARLSKRLKAIRSNLEAVGIVLDMNYRTATTRYIRITHTPKE